MKKLLKLSLLVGIFMAILTIRSYASNAQVSYSKNGSSTDITVTLSKDPSANEDFCNAINTDGWTLNGTEMKKTVANTDTTPYFKYYYYTIDDDTEVISIATPYTMKVNDTFKLTTTGATIKSISNEASVKNTSSTEIQAIAPGTATIEIISAIVGTNTPSYKWEVTVEGSSGEDPVAGNYTAKYEGNKLIISGLPDGEYRYFADTNSTATDDGLTAKNKLKKDGSNYIHEYSLDLLVLNQDIYAHVYTDNGSSSSKVTDIKITKPEFNDANYFTDYTDATYMGCLFKFNFPFNLNSEGSVIKFRYKIGRINDNSVLLSIKNNESSGFSKLAEYAKNDNSPVFNETIASNDFNGYSGNINLTGQQLVNDAYYYLYAELDTENGKYIPLSSITLAEASVYPDIDYHWYMFFYGSSKFNFDGVEEPATPSEKKEKLPDRLADTGEKALVFSLVGIAAVASVVLFRKNKNIKIK